MGFAGFGLGLLGIRMISGFPLGFLVFLSFLATVTILAVKPAAMRPHVLPRPIAAAEISYGDNVGWRLWSSTHIVGSQGGRIGFVFLTVVIRAHIWVKFFSFRSFCAILSWFVYIDREIFMYPNLLS